MSEYDSDGDSSDVECPTCARTDFESVQGMRSHHAQTHDEPIRVTVTCENCGDVDEIPPSNAKRMEHHFCNNECQGEWMSGENHPMWGGGFVEVSCENCGEVKEVVPSVKQCRENHFCDRDCHSEWMAENKTGREHPLWRGVSVDCAWCGKTKEVEPSRIRRSDRFFCDIECHGEWLSENNTGKNNPSWNGGEYVYGSGWSEDKKERIRERQERKCAACGVNEDDLPRKLDVHHIEKARWFSNDETRNDESNLVALCRPCHIDWEHMSPLRPQVE